MKRRYWILGLVFVGLVGALNWCYEMIGEGLNKLIFS
jgi:hypothetical protein